MIAQNLSELFSKQFRMGTFPVDLAATPAFQEAMEIQENKIGNCILYLCFVRKS
jgi:hypothetical protein